MRLQIRRTAEAESAGTGTAQTANLPTANSESYQEEIDDEIMSEMSAVVLNKRTIQDSWAEELVARQPKAQPNKGVKGNKSADNLLSVSRMLHWPNLEENILVHRVFLSMITKLRIRTKVLLWKCIALLKLESGKQKNHVVP